MKNIFALCLLFAFGSAYGAVVVDTGNVVSATPSSTISATFTQSVTVGGSDNMLVMACSAWVTGSMFSAAPTYNGVAMTQYFQQVGVGFLGNQGQEIWYLASPATGTNTASATFSAGTVNGVRPVACSFIPMSGVASGTPFGTIASFVSASLNTGTATASGAGSSGVYLGMGFPFYTSVSTGGSPMVNLFTANALPGNGSISTDYIPGTSSGAFTYTGSGGTNSGVIIVALPVLSGASHTGAAYGVNHVLASQWVYVNSSQALPSSIAGEFRYECDATSGAVTLTLPTAALNWNIYSLVKTDSSGNACTFATTSSQTINGSSTKGTSTQWATVKVISDNTNWVAN